MFPQVWQFVDVGDGEDTPPGGGEQLHRFTQAFRVGPGGTGTEHGDTGFPATDVTQSRGLLRADRTEDRHDEVGPVAQVRKHPDTVLQTGDGGGLGDGKTVQDTGNGGALHAPALGVQT